MKAQNQTESAAAASQAADVRRKLCDELQLKMPSDSQIYGDALAEIKRLKAAIEDAKRRKGEIREDYE